MTLTETDGVISALLVPMVPVELGRSASSPRKAQFIEKIMNLWQ